MARLIAIAAVTVALACAGCYRGPSSVDPDLALFPSTGLPYGVMAAPPDRKPGPGPRRGIYASRRDGDEYCCWLARSATFDVQIPAKSRELTLRIFLPSIPFRNQPQTAAVAVDGGSWHYFGPLGVGAHHLRVPLAMRRQPRVATITLRAGYSFVPVRRRINGDSRALSMYLKSVMVR